MSKKYTNSLKLNLPTGDFCIRVNEELQKNLIKDAEEHADKIRKIKSALNRKTNRPFIGL